MHVCPMSKVQSYVDAYDVTVVCVHMFMNAFILLYLQSLLTLLS